MQYRDLKTHELKYDEEGSFLIWIHVMEKLKYRNVYDRELSKTYAFFQSLDKHLKCAQPEMHFHLMEENDATMAVYFLDVIITIFVVKLYYCHPDNLHNIFDVFLCQGESLIFNLICQFFKLKENKILSLYGNDLMHYLKVDFIKECVTENDLKTYVPIVKEDFNAETKVSVF